VEPPANPARFNAPSAYGPHKILYNRFVRWSRLGVFDRIFAALAARGGRPERIMIDATHLKAHRTAASLLKKGLFPAASAAPRAGQTRSRTRSATSMAGRSSCCSPKGR
jgi:transposase